MHTKSIYSKKLRDKLMHGAYLVYRPVSGSLGPLGKNVVINKPYLPVPLVIHDGYKIAREITPEDKNENSGARILQEASFQHVEKVGDGTTLVTILGYQIAKKAMTLIDSGINAMTLRKGLDEGKDILIDEINKLSIPVKTKQDKINIATISSANKKIGKMIGETLHEIGLEGVLIVQDSKNEQTLLEHQEGIRIDRGYVSPYFITDPRDMSATVKSARILITDREIDDIYALLPFIEEQLKPNQERNLVIIAQDVKGTALASFIETKRKGQLNILCVKAPAHANLQKEMLEDIAVMTGGRFISEESGIDYKDIQFEDLGYADIVKAGRDATTIIGNKGDIKAIEDRMEGIKKQMNDPDTEFDKEKLKERLAKMTGGVWTIKAGGATEVEMNEVKERIDDAIKATQAAMREGIVPGGEVALLKIREVLKNKMSDDNEYAFRILYDAVAEPFYKLLKNAEMNPGYYMAKLEDKSFGYGVDVTDGQIKDMIKSGIVDPALVLTQGLTSAVSVATMLTTIDASINIIEDDKGQNNS